MSGKLYIVIGAYGSGKSEYSINLALNLNQSFDNVTLVDLDVVNPYFRSRDVRERFAKLNIDVIAPEGQYMHADLPMISPRIRGAIEDRSRTVILDVGGDPAGCRALVRFVPDIKERGYELYFVINTRRPFTANETEIIEMLDSLESMSRLKTTHLICNTNLLQETTVEMVDKGIGIIDDVANRKDLIFEEFLILDQIESKFPDNLRGKSKRVLNYFLNKPWERVKTQGI